jgi:hypothetical protein
MILPCARKHGRYGHRDATMILIAKTLAAEFAVLHNAA